MSSTGRKRGRPRKSEQAEVTTTEPRQRKKADVDLGDALLAALQKNKLEVYPARDAAEVVGWLDSGNYALNWAMSGRFLLGYPLGHTVELYGDNSTGKSYLIQQAIRNAQAGGGVALLDDTEGAFNPQRAEQTLGINVDKLAHRDSDTINEHIATVLAFAQAISDLKIKQPSVLACDSLANLMSDAEADNPYARDMKRQQDIKRLFRVTGNKVSDLPIAYLVANHKISLMGQTWGKESDSSGGGGPKYQASIRIDLRTPSRIKDSGDNFVGVLIKAFIEKNRISIPWRTVQFAIPFYRPIEAASGLIPVLLSLGVVTLDGDEIVLNGGSYTGVNTGFRFYKSKDKFLMNDVTAQKILDTYPNLLQEVDQWLAERPNPYAVNTETGEVEE